MDNAYNQSAVAYENGPKEVNVKRGLHDGDKQFGKDKMPQDESSVSKGSSKKVMSSGRHKEYR